MIIGIDASRANHAQKTGVEWYAFFVIQELKKKLTDPSQPPLVGEEIRVLLYSDVPLQGDLAILPENWSSRVLRWPPRRLWTQVRLSLEMFFHPPDVLFIPAHVFPLIHPKKTVMTVHDIAGIKFPKSYNWFERWYSTRSAKYAVKKLWKVAVPSEFTKRELVEFIVNSSKPVERIKKKILVVHNGYDEIFHERVTEDKKQRILQKYHITKPYLLSIARLEEKKNTWRIIKAFDSLRQNHNLQLVLIGQPGFGYEKVKQSLKESPYKEDIILPGWVGKEDLPALMQDARVFVFPSLYEGFGIPVLEAFASGTPVVFSGGSSLEEVGGRGGVIVDPESISSLASGILSLLEDSRLCQEKVDLGKERVCEFSWQKCGEKVARILLEN